MFVKARQYLDEIAGPVAEIELVHEDFIPRIFARTWRPRQAEDIRRVGDACGGARLYCRRTDFLLAHQEEHVGKTIHALLEQRLDRFGGHIPSGEPGTSSGDNDVN